MKTHSQILVKWMDHAGYSICFFFALILIVQCPSSTGKTTVSCLDISTLDINYQDQYVDPNDASVRYITYDIPAESYEKKCFQMKIQKNNTTIKFSWKKNGGSDTDLSFYKTHNFERKRKVYCLGSGSTPCIGCSWTPYPYIYQADAGDVLEWEFWCRTNRLSEGGKASIAIYSEVEEPPENHLPGKPVLNLLSSRLIANDLLWLSAISNDLDNDNLCYCFNWGDGTVENTSFALSNTTISRNHSWHSQGSYEVRVGAMDGEGVFVWSDPCEVVVEPPENHLPCKPVLNLSSSRLISNDLLWLSAISNDLDNDNLCYCFNWGDGTVENTSFALSNTTILRNHSWHSQGSYEVRVGAMDGEGVFVWSDPCEVVVEPPENHLPGKPVLNLSSSRLISNDLLWLSAISNDLDNDNLCYCFNWGDGTVENTSFVLSNTTNSRNHSWRSQGSYEVRVGAMDGEGVFVWSDPCEVFVDPCSGLRFKRIPQIAYANEACELEIDLGTINERTEYCVDWGDGIISREANSTINHTWSVAGMYEIKVGIIPTDNSQVVWSDQTEIPAYEKETIHSQNCNLREVINESNDFVELCLIDPEYYVSGEIDIINKKHFRITSEDNSILRGLNRIDIMILLRDSTNITISNLTIVNLESGFKLINCSGLSILQNEIDFDGSGYGIRICSGQKITIKDNIIKKVGSSRHSDFPPVGIKVECGKNIDISSNSVYEENPPHPNLNPMVAYSVKNATAPQICSLSNINISISRSVRNIGIKYSNCDGRWDCSQDIIAYNGCTIPDGNQQDSCVWSV